MPAPRIAGLRRRDGALALAEEALVVEDGLHRPVQLGEARRHVDAHRMMGRQAVGLLEVGKCLLEALGLEVLHALGE